MLQVSAVNGKILEQKLPLGVLVSAGIQLDHCLATIAQFRRCDCIEENTKVNEIYFDGSVFHIETSRKQI